MITYEWGTSFGSDPEVVSLLRDAADFDAEQGFSAVQPVPTATEGEAPPGPVRELVARMREEVGAPGTTGEEDAIVAFLRLTPQSDGSAGVEFVVGPEYRSLGIATLLFEQLGLARGGATKWAGEGVRSLRAWSHGSHPAAERMSRRFGAVPVDASWRIIRPMHRPGSVPEVGPPEGVSLRALDPETDASTVAALARAEQDGPGADHPGREVLVAAEASGEVLGFVAFSPHPLTGEAPAGPGSVHVLSMPDRGAAHAVSRALLSATLLRLAEAGVREVEMSVDPLDEPLVRACRSVGFHHDQTDVCFSVPVDAPAAVA
ncbi:hypothetical protein ACFYRD_32615 [Streptomyces hirsutus]|uniref:hypothetical protein n=1 Tax=Streptomyces hirsutus TaxID=35620 RepID=UPI0033BCE9BA